MQKNDDKNAAIPLVQSYECLFDVALEIKEIDIKVFIYLNSYMHSLN